MSDVQSVSSPNSNKTVASIGGGLSGAALGSGIVALLTVKYPALNPIVASTIGALVAAAIGSIATFLTPLLTAAQHRAIRALDGGASPDQKDILTVGKAQAIVAAASSSKPAT